MEILNDFGVSRDSFTLLFSGLGVLVALFSLFNSWRSIRATRNFQKQEMRVEWTKNVIAWGNQVIRVLVQANYLSWRRTSEADFMEKQIDLMVRLSSLIDQGRFIFENDRSRRGRKKNDDASKDKPYAYQGHRPKILSVLVHAHDLIEKFADVNDDERRQLGRKILNYKREFVSLLQIKLDPAWFAKIAGKSTYDEVENRRY